MITAYATIEVAREAQAKGVYDFSPKPIKVGEFLEVVEKAAAAPSGVAKPVGPGRIFGQPACADGADSADRPRGDELPGADVVRPETQNLRHH